MIIENGLKAHLNTSQGLLPRQVGFLGTKHFRAAHDPQLALDLQVVHVGDIEEKEKEVRLVHALRGLVLVEPIESLQREIYDQYQ